MFNKTDYTPEGFILPIERENIKGYASVNAVLYSEEDGLDVTGNYFVYLMHPLRGSMKFTLEPYGSEKGWEVAERPVLVEDDILQEIINAIESRKNKVTSVKATIESN